jgi:hypothetical protein
MTSLSTLPYFHKNKAFMKHSLIELLSLSFSLSPSLFSILSMFWESFPSDVPQKQRILSLQDDNSFAEALRNSILQVRDIITKTREEMK